MRVCSVKLLAWGCACKEEQCKEGQRVRAYMLPGLVCLLDDMAGTLREVCVRDRRV